MDLKWNGAEWNTCLSLPSWADLLEGSVTVEVTFLGDESASESRPPTEQQVAALQDLREHGHETRGIVERAMRAYYDSVLPKYLAFRRKYGDSVSTALPESPTAGEFAKLHVLQGIFVHSATRDGLAYLGFSFHALWEREHGVGVVVHRRRVIEVAGADTSFNTWLSERDAKSP
jgi:hypothetical protein